MVTVSNNCPGATPPLSTETGATTTTTMDGNPTTSTLVNGQESTTASAGVTTTTSASVTVEDKTLDWVVPEEPFPDMCLVPGQKLTLQWSGSWDHNVEKVSEEVYESCTGITNTDGTKEGSYEFIAEEAGDFYFVCGVKLEMFVGVKCF